MSKPKKVAAYTVSGITFLGAVTGLLVNMTRIGDSFAPVDMGEIQVMPTFISEEPPESEYVDSDWQHNLTYRVDKTPELIDIGYESSIHDSPARNVGILGEGPYIALPKVGIDLKLVNNTGEAIFVTDAVLNIDKSRVNPDPLFVLIHSEADDGEIVWFNDGWGEPDTLTLSAKIVGSGTSEIDLPFNRSAFEMYGSTPYEFSIWPLIADEFAEFASSAEEYESLLDQEQAFITRTTPWADLHVACMRKYGDLESFAEAETEYNNNPIIADDVTDNMLRVMPYGCRVNVTGTLSYTWQNEGVPQDRSIEFDVYVNITPPEGLGAAGFEPTGLFDAELRPEGEKYSVTVPVSQPVAAGGFDRFIIWVGAEKSSLHDLTVTLQYNVDQEIKTRPIRLDYMRPRSTADDSYFDAYKTVE